MDDGAGLGEVEATTAAAGIEAVGVPSDPFGAFPRRETGRRNDNTATTATMARRAKAEATLRVDFMGGTGGGTGSGDSRSASPRVPYNALGNLLHGAGKIV